MASKALVFLLLLLPLALFSVFSGSAEAQGLTVGFYNTTCPDAETIVYNEMSEIIKNAPSLAAALLRMHFHDCFVRGCDASILLNGSETEKAAFPNLSVRGFGVIDRVKAKLEQACPATVSCADILALAARDAVTLTNGPSWAVPTGRRDGRVSIGDDTNQLPPPNVPSISDLTHTFACKGLSAKDLVVLSGAHTLGISHCSSFSNRLQSDDTLDPAYAAKLRAKCKSDTTLVEMDPGSRSTFDTSYFELVSKRRGLFASDAVLLQDPQTRAYVRGYASGCSSEFFKDFGESMVKMSSIGVLTGTEGEIRKLCSARN
ncbi:peroxidase 1-like [Zingiber officinale]|uniref:peroxidase 1-like n=1 Tax=Zingiber officinale TaxID=94328 RepID=UPI001C4C8715|nr:peroxidase 1-like [Zingiber officinale]